MATILDYQQSLIISRSDPSFSSLLFSLIRKSDSNNLEKIAKEWPELYDEFKCRYKANFGALDEEELQYVQSS